MQTNANINRAFAAQFPKNLITNVFSFIISIIIGIAITPFFISTLGIAAYGIIPLAISMTGYVGMIVQALNMAVSRFLTVDLQKEDYHAANKTFNTAVFGLTAIIMLLAPFIFAFAFLVPWIFNVPAGQENDVIILFIGVFVSFLIRSWSGNFAVPLFAYNRLDLLNIINIISIIVQNGLIILAFMLYGPSLIFVSLAIIVAAIVTSGFAIIWGKSFCPFLKLSIHDFDRSQLKDIFNMSWWVIVDNIGTLLLLSIDLIVVNILFGAESSGQYAVALQLIVLIRSASSTITGIMTPMIFIYYAKEQLEALTKLIVSSVKLIGLLIALPIGLICGFAPQILTIWVGAKYAFLAPLLVILAIHLSINLAVLPLFSINVAYNKIRIPGIATLLFGGANILLAIALPLITGWGFYGVAIAGAIVLTSRHSIFVPWYAAKMMGIKMSKLTMSLPLGLIMTIVIMIGSMVIGTFISITSMLSLIIIGGFIGFLYILLLWKFGLSPFERSLFISYVPKRLRSVVI